MIVTTYNTTVQRIPSGDLGASVEHIGKFQWHNAENWVMFAVT